ncbi:SNARE associated golgi protein [mine drainage metagenome]|uniref:SNARE associated golgi protein n=1 Tax=mine drainage metagenome TaxID=410659 RepID=A0A1J5QL54_9ZZZZ
MLTLGQTWGGVATYVAASVSCVITFLTIRGIGGNALRQLDSALARSIFRRLDAHPIAGVALLRVLFQTVPALNYALALSGVGFRNYLVGTLLGLPLPVALYCVFFDYLAKLLRIG